MRRREFVGAAATLAIGATTGSAVASAAPDLVTEHGDFASVIADRLLEAYPSRGSLEAIGDAYWLNEGDGAAVCRSCLSQTVEDFLGHLRLSEGDVRQMAPDAIRTRIKTGTAEDFAEGRIIRVEGWLLGEAEARLCMIAALRAA